MINDHTRAIFEKADANGEAYTFDDFLLEPSLSAYTPVETSLKTRLTRNYEIGLPILSAAMDTVTEAKMATAMAIAGGVGVIHRNCTIEAQCEFVIQTRLSQSGFIDTPKTVPMKMTIAEFLAKQERRRLEGQNIFHRFPVTISDEDKEVVGLISRKDIERNEHDKELTMGDIMTLREKLINGKPGMGPEEALAVLHDEKKSVLMLLDDNHHLHGMYFSSALQRRSRNDVSTHSQDKSGKLLVIASVGTGIEAMRRVEQLAQTGVELFSIDSAHGHTTPVRDMVTFIKRLGKLEAIAGNVATKDATTYLLDAGADAIKVGIGPGSICTTRQETGFGVPQLSAIVRAAIAAEPYGVPIIGDGGANFAGDLVKAYAAGASSYMIGSMAAGTDETPGFTEMILGKPVRFYRGMASPSAINQRSSVNRYNLDGLPPASIAPQGVDGYVPYRGPVAPLLAKYAGSIQAGLGYAGALNITELQARAKFVRHTGNGLRESHVHGIIQREG